MNFKSAKDLLALCRQEEMTISQVMRQRECDLAETTQEEIQARMMHSWEIMKESTQGPTREAVPSMGGLIGGEAKKLTDHRSAGRSILGTTVSKAITYAMAVLEVNASMGLITAAPTAGSAGVLPGVLLALQEEYELSDKAVIDALFNASAIGYLAMRNATVAGSMGGCQAEIGVASAMAASAATELMGGSPLQCTYAASTVLMNMLGLICDPVLGLVEYPCQNRNASGAANALIAAEMALSGITQMIPLDEMIDCMFTVGKRMPAEYRETAKGGCAATPTACALCKGC